MTGVACLILAIISGILARNFFIAIIFPILLVAFLLMWRNLKKDIPKEKEVSTQIKPEEVSNQNTDTQLPPV